MEGSPLMQQWRYMAQVDLDTAVSQVNTPSRWRSRVEYTPKYILSTATPALRNEKYQG